MIKLTFSQPHFESGSIQGEGIDWYWGGRDLNGPEEIIEDIAEAVHDAIHEKYDDHLTEEARPDLDFGFEVELDWDGSDPDVTDAKIKLEFWDCDKDVILAEAQEIFTTTLRPATPLVLGENTIELGEDKNGDPVEIEILIETKP